MHNNRAMKESPYKLPALVALAFSCFFLITVDFLTAIGLGFTVFLFGLFIVRLGTSIPVLELMLIMASGQWILGPFLSYKADFTHFKYYMYVPEDVYMALAVPGVIFFALGVFLVLPRYSMDEINSSLKNTVIKNERIPYTLVFIGFVFQFISPFAPAALAFVFYLASSLKFVGLALLLFQQASKSKWTWFILIMGFMTLTSIIQGLFHDLLLWSAFMFSFVVLQVQMGMRQKILIIMVGFGGVFLIQSVKSEYRETSRELGNLDKLNLFNNLIIDRLTGSEKLLESGTTDMANVRLNQGWIISAIMDNIPERSPYVDGETIITALQSSLLPRFLVSDKKQAGGRDNFRRFTGLSIKNDTSMGISVMGEAYANFGRQGAWVFMFLFGITLGLVYKKLILYGRKMPVVIVFIPLIFLQVVKAETELYVVLNHFVKTLIFVILFLWFARKVLRWKV